MRKKGVEVVSFQNRRSGRLDLKKVLAWLGKHEISSVMVEGGALLFTDFLEKHLADKIIITQSAKLIGGEKAPTFFEGKGSSEVAQAIRLKDTNCFTIGKDLILEGYL